jgi:glutamate 5-kinase
VIANGKQHGVADILRGGDIGTLFRARGDLDSRERWVHGLVEAGKLLIDAGGERAIRDQGRSLLPVGITACEGSFEHGDAVVVVGPSGPIAKGLVNYRASEVRSILGKRTSEIAAVLGKKEFDEVIHRDNMVLLR